MRIPHPRRYNPSVSVAAGTVSERERVLRLLREKLPELRQRFPIKRMALFGSYARDEATQNSDIDLMVEFEQRVGWEIVDLKEELEQLLGRRVDLATLNALKRKPLLWESVREALLDVEATRWD